MRHVDTRLSLRLTALVLGIGLANTAIGDTLKITVTNNQPSGGFATSPVWFGVHDGTFHSFDSGSAASDAIRNVAELGNTTPLSNDFAGHGPQTLLASGGSLAKFLPGSTNSTTLEVANPSVDRFLSFAAMVVPSNDLFVGNDNPTAFALFDASGHFNGPLTIRLYGENVWDAGTEVNNIQVGGAFITGVDPTVEVKENGTVGLFLSRTDATTYLNSIKGLDTPAGYAISHLIATGDPLLTIQIQSVPEPSSLAMAGLGLCGLVGVAWRKSRRVTKSASLA